MENPYRTARLGGRVVETLRGEEALAVADRLSQRYVGADFPMRGPTTIAFRIEVESANLTELPFSHPG